MFMRSPFDSYGRVSVSAGYWQPNREPNASDVVCFDGGDYHTFVVDEDVTVGAIQARRLAGFEVTANLTIAGAAAPTEIDLTSDGYTNPALRVSGALTTGSALTLAGRTELLGGGVLARSGSGSFVVPAGAELELTTSCCQSAGGAVGESGHGAVAAVDVFGSGGRGVHERGVGDDRGGSGSVSSSNGGRFVNALAGSVAPEPDRQIALYGPVTNEGTITIPATG